MNNSRLLLQPVPASTPSRPGVDYTLSRVDWFYVDKALTDLAAKLERDGYRGKAHEVRVLCAMFFDGHETVIRDVQP